MQYWIRGRTVWISNQQLTAGTVYTVNVHEVVVFFIFKYSGCSLYSFLLTRIHITVPRYSDRIRKWNAWGEMQKTRCHTLDYRPEVAVTGLHKLDKHGQPTKHMHVCRQWSMEEQIDYNLIIKNIQTNIQSNAQTHIRTHFQEPKPPWRK